MANERLSECGELAVGRKSHLYPPYDKDTIMSYRKGNTVLQLEVISNTLKLAQSGLCDGVTLSSFQLGILE